MALQTFTAGQVLTAAQVTALQTNDFNQTVSTKTANHTLVAADKGTRVEMNSASTTTITVNTSLFNAGDTLFIQNIGAGVCTITAGTATVATAGSLALAQNAGGTLYFTSAGVSIFFPTVASVAVASGLTLINTTTFTAQTTVSFNNVFTATYENYVIKMNLSSSTTGDLNFRVRAGGTDLSTATYYWSAEKNDNSAASTFASNLSEGTIGRLRTTKTDLTLEVYSPQLAKRTSFISSSIYFLSNSIFGNFQSATSVDNVVPYDGFSIIGVSATITGTVRVYGVEN